VLLAVTSLQFVVPFALNQSGSVVYVYLLGSAGAPLSMLPKILSWTLISSTLWLMLALCRHLERSSHLQLADVRLYGHHESTAR